MSANPEPPVKPAGDGAGRRGEDPERSFQWFTPKKRTATIYEDVTADSQPSVHRYLDRGRASGQDAGRKFGPDVEVGPGGDPLRIPLLVADRHPRADRARVDGDLAIAEATELAVCGVEVQTRRQGHIRGIEPRARQVRETLLPVALRTSHPGVADDLFFAPVVAEVSDVHPRLRDMVLAAPHPLIEARRMDEYEALLCAGRGSSYLDLEEAVARHALADVIDGESGIVDVSPLRPPRDPFRWLEPADVRAVVDADLHEKESGRMGSDFQSRLIGLFPAVPDGDGRSYFNSPTCCRLEHGRVRILPRDRFGILGLRGSERLAFEALCGLLVDREDGHPGRLFGVKYPYAARILAGSVAREAATLAEAGPVKVVFIEGSEGTVNRATGGLLDALLAEKVAPFAEYHRFVARDAVRKQLPIRPGGLPLIQDRLAELVPSSFSPPIDEGRLFAEPRTPSAFPAPTVAQR